MRNMVKTLAAGTLVVCFSIGLAYADGTTGAKYTAKPLQKALRPGGTVQVEVYLSGAKDLGAFQFGMKATGGTRGTMTVEKIEMNDQNPQFVFKGLPSIKAVDDQQMRAGGAILNGSANIETDHYVATVTLRASNDADGTFQVNLDPGEDTFLRDSSARPVPVQFGPAAAVTVSNRVGDLQRAKRRSSR